MQFYWVIFIVLLGSLMAIVMAAQYSVALKHQFDADYKPKFIINEPEVYVIGALFGSVGLLVSYVAFKEIRLDDRLNHRRFLWISLGLFLIHALVFALLAYYHVILFDLA
jgi:hypothetical protein